MTRFGAGEWNNHPGVTFAEFAHTIGLIKADGVQKIVVVGVPPVWTEPLQLALYTYDKSHPGPLRSRTTYDLTHAPSVVNQKIATWATRLHIGSTNPPSARCDPSGCLTHIGSKLDDVTAFDGEHLTACAAGAVVHTQGWEMLPGLVK
jgi:hypothetical protein